MRILIYIYSKNSTETILILLLKPAHEIDILSFALL